jgi:hypothetical protein
MLAEVYVSRISAYVWDFRLQTRLLVDDNLLVAFLVIKGHFDL